MLIAGESMQIWIQEELNMLIAMEQSYPEIFRTKRQSFFPSLAFLWLYQEMNGRQRNGWQVCAITMKEKATAWHFQVFVRTSSYPVWNWRKYRSAIWRKPLLWHQRLRWGISVRRWTVQRTVCGSAVEVTCKAQYPRTTQMHLEPRFSCTNVLGKHECLICLIDIFYWDIGCHQRSRLDVNKISTSKQNRITNSLRIYNVFTDHFQQCKSNI